MPAAVIGHGNPMNALESNRYTDAWRSFGGGASWVVRGPRTTTQGRFKTLYLCSEIEPARIDGACEWRIYRFIVLPQIKPALATLGLLAFMFNWNAYLWPLIVLTENDKRTIPVILTWYSTQHGAQLNLVMAASVLMVVPVLIFFLFTQRWIVAGLTLTGGK